MLYVPRRSPLAYPAGVAPDFDPSHVAAGGIYLSCVASGGALRNVLNGQVGTASGSPSATIKGNLGPAVDMGAGGASVSFPTPAPSAIQQATLFGIAQFPSGNYPSLIEAAGPSHGVLVRVNMAAGAKLSLTCSTVADHPSGIVISAGVPYFIAVSFSVSASVINFLAMNLLSGRINTQTLSGAISINNTVSPIVVGDVYPTGNPGAIIAAAGLNTQLMSMPQLLQWSADPWSFWYQNRARYRVGASLAAFKAAWARNNNSIFGVGIAA